MMLASFLIVILGISTATGDKASHHVEAISIAGAVALLVTYLVVARRLHPHGLDARRADACASRSCR